MKGYRYPGSLSHPSWPSTRGGDFVEGCCLTFFSWPSSSWPSSSLGRLSSSPALPCHLLLSCDRVAAHGFMSVWDGISVRLRESFQRCKDEERGKDDMDEPGVQKYKREGTAGKISSRHSWRVWALRSCVRCTTTHALSIVSIEQKFFYVKRYACDLGHSSR